MSDAELDNLIDALKPDLRIAIRSVLDGELIHAFDMDGRREGNRMSRSTTIFIAQRPMAILVEFILEGVQKSTEEIGRLALEATGKG